MTDNNQSDTLTFNRNEIHYTFPTVEGKNLDGRRFTLPAGIEGQAALLLIAFRQDQQEEINTWIPAGRALAARYPGLAVYELPTIYRLPRISQAFIDGGMRAGIPDPVARATTITLYLDRGAFQGALGISDNSHIHSMLITPEGEILWLTSGPMTEEKRAALERAAAAIFA